MKYEEFLDHLLAVYYHSNKKNPKLSITPFWIVEMIDDRYSSKDVVEMMNYFGAEGYLLHYFQKSGTVSRITPKGQMYYESIDKSKREKIKAFLTNKGIFKILNKFKRPEDSLKYNEKMITNKLKEIKSKLQKRNDIDKDLVKDIEVIQTEFSKRSPEKEILRIKIENILEENILFEEFQELKDKLNVA